MSRRGLTRRAALRSIAGSAAAVGVAGSAAAQESTPAQVRPDWGGWLQGVDGGYQDLRGQDRVTVRVGAQGNGGAFAFAPAGIWIDPGTTVVWQWTGEGGGHNVVGESGPASSLDSGSPVAEAGYTFEHTFEQTGITTYYCAPHRSLGMKGAVAVGDDVPTVAYEPPSAGGDGGRNPLAAAPEGVTILLLFYGMTGLAVLTVAGAGWVGDVRKWRRQVAEAAGIERTAEASAAEPEREIGHDEYDPYGTLSLVAFYLAVVVLMWVFMYFVEFLGNGPTVVG